MRSALEAANSPADRAAIFISDMLGSIWFLAGCLLSIIIYILWNCGWIAGVKPFDPSPFNVLDTVLSVFAIVLTISVLISQKRQRRLEKIREEVEFEVNVRGEKEITKILAMLHEMQLKMGIQNADPELEEMKKDTDLKKIHESVKKDHE
jgi:uncharacterized membrane protein